VLDIANRITLPDMTEQLRYVVVRAFPGFEVRRYPEHALVEVRVESEFERGAALAFRPLSRYLDGDNHTATSFAMTAPVLQQPDGPSRQVVSFVLPHDIDLASVPLPRDASLSIRVVPPHEAAALRFRGRWSTKHFFEHGEKLLEDVGAADLLALGPIYYARFDPAFKPGFLKHNEALVRVTSA